MTRLHRLSAVLALWLCALLALPAFAADLPYAGACLLRDAAGTTLYRGTCAVSRPPLPGATACRSEAYAVVIPGQGRAEVLRSLESECPSVYRGEAARFVASDSEGALIVAAQSGVILRFDPGPDQTLPQLDAFLRGLDSCDRSQQQLDFFARLQEGYPVTAGDPDGAIGPRGEPILWPPGGFVAPEDVTARKSGAEVSLALRLRGSYHGLSLTGMRFVFRTDAPGFVEQSLIFDAPQARVQAEFGAMLALRQKELARARGAGRWAEVAPSEPGRIDCVFAN